MARLVDNLSQYLIDQSIAVKEGKDIFIGFMPENLGNCIMLDQTGGVEPDKYVPIEQPTVQIMVRNTSYNAGFYKMTAIYHALHQLLDDAVLETGGVDVMTVFALQEPVHLGKDENDRHIFSVNFVFKIRHHA